jgi:hypothetical protein
METFTESLILTLTPSLKQRLQDFADEQNWHVTAAIRYFIQDGLDSAARRAELAQEATACWPPR